MIRRAVLFFIILLLGAETMRAQRFTMAVEQRTVIAYIGLDNPVSCTVEKVSCDSVFLGTNNGEIKKIGCNSFTYRVAEHGDTKLIVYVKEKNGTRIIGEKGVRVRNIPDPVTSVGGLRGGVIKKKYLLEQPGVGAFIEEPIGIEVRFLVTEFNYSIVRNDSLILYSKNISALFSEEIKKGFEQLQKGDLLLLTNILVKKADGRIVMVKPMEFTLTD